MKAVRACERRLRRERTVLDREREMARDRRGDAAHDLRRRARPCERAVLADRQQLIDEVIAAKARRHLLARRQCTRLAEREIGTREHAMPEQDRGLAAI